MVLWWYCESKQAQAQAHASKHTHHQAHTIITTTTQAHTSAGRKTMNDKQFIDFLNTSTTKGGAVFNLKTNTCSKQALSILKDTQYKALAKQHINATIVKAYHDNAQFKEKLESVMAQYNITLVA